MQAFLKESAIRPIRKTVSTALTDLSGELPAMRAEPTATRTGVWTIRPDQALLWSRRSPAPGDAEPGPPSAAAMLRALGVLSAVLVAGMLGGVGAWALSA